ncbi:hypothetical protein CWI37_0073p0010 [Hamiltosporidium tvaerminnensis]|uniref:Uncharacterized protein n=1 Tax=Hamiltosporidium tvaerminnensis TaxID=1176355 RepID=A0A4Q9LAU7_9MICR|nr:hypothetical protein LUQ84_001179 [Hamiltosporidium tvaerminnensis]TBU04903.1 hypothetical protein CWI37_0073p0010 [Hamiltosporidium tvaerminnensis]
MLFSLRTPTFFIISFACIFSKKAQSDVQAKSNIVAGASDRPTGKSELFGSLFGLGAAKVADPFYNPYRAGYRRGVGYGYGTGAAVGGVGYGFP